MKNIAVSTPQAIAYLERHPDAVFAADWNSSITLSLDGGQIRCSNNGSVLVLSMVTRWRLVSPKPKRERVRLGRVEVSAGHADYPDVATCIPELPDGNWTIYAVKT